MKYIFWGIVSLVVLLMVSVGFSFQNTTTVVHIKSDDEQQAITIFERGNIRIICNGLLQNIPEADYVMIDFGEIDSTSDALYFCWKENGWNATIPKVEIIESKLNSKDHIFGSELPKDDRGIPTSISFSKENCNIYDFSLKKLMGVNGSVSVN